MSQVKLLNICTDKWSLVCVCLLDTLVSCAGLAEFYTTLAEGVTSFVARSLAYWLILVCAWVPPACQPLHREVIGEWADSFKLIKRPHVQKLLFTMVMCRKAFVNAQCISHAKNRKMSLQWASGHHNWMTENVIQSDMDPSKLVWTVHIDIGGLMTWGMFYWHTSCTFLPSEHHLIATVHPFFLNWYFKQDNDVPCRTVPRSQTYRVRSVSGGTERFATWTSMKAIHWTCMIHLSQHGPQECFEHFAESKPRPDGRVNSMATTSIHSMRKGEVFLLYQYISVLLPS